MFTISYTHIRLLKKNPLFVVVVVVVDKTKGKPVGKMGSKEEASCIFDQ